MNKHGMFKKALSLLLCAVIFAGLGLSGVTANAAGKKITDYSVGDIVEFGWYPQSKVTDKNMIAALNKAAGVDTANVATSTSVENGWISYNYYSHKPEYSRGGNFVGNMISGDWMRYKDIVIDSVKYRGVVFDSYRPYCTGYTSSADNSHQINNGYTTNSVYWFKYEPIKWRVLDPATGMVMSETILDSQAFNNYEYYGSSEVYGNPEKTYYANNYAESDIREWLNNDFYNTALSASQKNMIATTTLDNSACSTKYSKYDSATTNDKIYLLSYADALNTRYGFSSSYAKIDTNRQSQGSDYAKSQGLGVSTSSGYSGNSCWRLRSAGYGSRDTCIVGGDGTVINSYYASNTSIGVRPAFNFNPKSEIVQCKVTDIGSTDTDDDFPDFLDWLRRLLDWLRNLLNRFIEWLRSLLGLA